MLSGFAAAGFPRLLPIHAPGSRFFDTGSLVKNRPHRSSCLTGARLKEKAGVVGDNGVASEDAVRAAMGEVDRDDIARAKLALAAELILQRHPRLAHISPQDLIQEALFRTLQGRRKWRPAKIGFLGHVIGAMRSIASAATKSVAKGTVPAEPLEVVNGDGETWEVVPLLPAPSAEDTAIANEERALAEARLDTFHEELAKDAEALAIYERLCEGIPKRGIRAELGMPDKKFWTVGRRLSRLIHRLFKAD